MVTAATYLPRLLISLPAGAVVDRYDRAPLMWRAALVRPNAWPWPRTDRVLKSH